MIHCCTLFALAWREISPCCHAMEMLPHTLKKKGVTGGKKTGKSDNLCWAIVNSETKYIIKTQKRMREKSKVSACIA